jgi:hypothetical protein
MLESDPNFQYSFKCLNEVIVVVSDEERVETAVTLNTD